MMQAARDFFGLDEDVKKSYLSPTGNKFRGYTAATSYKRRGRPMSRKVLQVSWFENRGAMIEAGYAAEYADSFRAEHLAVISGRIPVRLAAVLLPPPARSRGDLHPGG